MPAMEFATRQGEKWVVDEVGGLLDREDFMHSSDFEHLPQTEIEVDGVKRKARVVDAQTVLVEL